MRKTAAAAIALLTVAGCAGGPAPSSHGVTVAATVAPITDIVRQVVGDRATVTGLIPEGVDSHTFEPSPSTIKALARATILFMDGLHLEGSTLKQARANMPGPVRESGTLAAGERGSLVVTLGDRTLPANAYAYDFTFPKEKGDPNPHVWMDPTFARAWSEIIRDVMVARDPANAAAYRANQQRFAAVLARLDAAIEEAVATIPAPARVLLTYHDSFAYFARRYGMRVLGAVQPNDFSEPSPREIQALIQQVRSLGVPAIFGSEVFPSKVLEQVARETHATYVDTVRDDELPGAPGAANHTYVGMIVEDVTVITTALGGDPSSVAAVPTAPTWRA